MNKVLRSIQANDPMASMLRRYFFILLTLLGATSAAMAAPRPAVLELFTSQGCSSCPPADAYLHTLSARSDVLALAFHVGYWDSLGWRDRFALPQSVERQNVYAQHLRRASVYTPQLMIDGHIDHVGSDKRAIEKDLTQKREGVPIELGVKDGAVQIALSAHADHAPSDILLIAYLRHASSKIGQGENSGRTLEEFNIVRSVRSVASWAGEARSYQVAVTSLPPEATDIAVLVQQFKQGAIIGAATRSIR